MSEKVGVFIIIFVIVLVCNIIFEGILYFLEINNCSYPTLLHAYRVTDDNIKKFFYLLKFPLYFLICVPFCYLRDRVEYKLQYDAKDKRILQELKSKFHFQNPGLIKYNKFGIVASILIGMGVIFCVYQISV